MKELVFLTLLFVSYLAPAQSSEEQRFLDTLKLGGTYLIGKEMRGFKLMSVDRDLYSAESLKHKITFINFWYEACVPCMAEMRALESLYEEFKQDSNFRFLSFTFENKEVINRVVQKFKITYPVLSASIDSCTYLNFGKGYPTTIITGKKKKIVYFNIGGDMDPDKADLYFKINVYPLLEGLLK